jgi:hypothetical protein
MNPREELNREVEELVDYVVTALEMEAAVYLDREALNHKVQTIIDWIFEIASEPKDG